MLKILEYVPLHEQPMTALDWKIVGLAVFIALFLIVGFITCLSLSIKLFKSAVRDARRNRND